MLKSIMRKFDIQAQKARQLQYWSSLETTGNNIDAQVASSVSAITFVQDHVTNNRPIVRGAASSILLNSDPGVVTTDDLTDFAFTLLIKPTTSDLWLFKFSHNGQDIGVRLLADNRLELVWWVDTVEFTPTLELVSDYIVYSEDVAYISFSRINNIVTLTLNTVSVSIAGSNFVVNDFQLGGGTGKALVDKIAMTVTGSNLSINEYRQLFKSQRLDTVPRPDGYTTFNYLLDAYRPEQFFIEDYDFYDFESQRYATVKAPYDTGVWQIIKRASFLIEYSLDNGETWATLPDGIKLPDYYPSIILRHSTDTAEDYWIEFIFTYAVSIPMSHYTAIIDGLVYLPSEVGFGYFDADAGDFDDASITIAPSEAGETISTIELLAIVNDPGLDVFETNLGSMMPSYTSYINGQARALSTLQPDQLYHIVITFSTPVDSLILNPSKAVGLKIVGFGAGNVVYAASDAYYIYNTFVGNPLITALELIGQVTDGATDSGEPAQVLDLQWDR